MSMQFICEECNTWWGHGGPGPDMSTEWWKCPNCKWSALPFWDKLGVIKDGD